MKSVIDFLINPVFSEPVMEFYMTTFGEKLGIILLGFVKMFLVFAGGFIITFPVISLIELD